MKSKIQQLAQKALFRLPSIKSIPLHALPKIEQSITSRKQIWQCATPKSASTYLNLVLATLWADDCCQGSPVPHFGDRAQEPDTLSVFRRIIRSNQQYYSGHLHQRCTHFFKTKFLENQGKLGGGVIVQTRDLKDTIVSLKDHIEKDYNSSGKIKGPWFVSLETIWPSLSEDEKYHAIAIFYSHWHIDFSVSWKSYERALPLDYHEVTHETADTIKEICTYFAFKKSDEQIRKAIIGVAGEPNESKRMNVGCSGRGEQLIPPSTKAYLEEVEALLGRSQSTQR